jgi:hypothetical protein
MGSYVSINNNTPDTWMCRLGVSNLGYPHIILETVMSAPQIYDTLRSHDFKTINAGESHKWGKMSLSLLRAAVCIKVTPVNDTITYTETVYGNRLISGPTDGSTNYYDIHKWLHHRSVNETHFHDPNSPW